MNKKYKLIVLIVFIVFIIVWQFWKKYTPESIFFYVIYFLIAFLIPLLILIADKKQARLISLLFCLGIILSVLFNNNYEIVIFFKISLLSLIGLTAAFGVNKKFSVNN